MPLGHGLVPHYHSLLTVLVTLVPQVSPGIAHPLLEGLKNGVICLDNSITGYVSSG